MADRGSIARYWGGNIIVKDGRIRMGDMPSAATWVRLEVPASLVSLANSSISGFSFIVWGGRAWIDRPGKSSCTTPSPDATLATQYEYVWFAGQPVAQFSGTTAYWTFNDHLGTPILQTDSTGAVAWRAEYEPYGEVYKQRVATNTHQPLRFPGQEAEQLDAGQNGATDRRYNIFRWYRSSFGRYTQEDPIGLAGGKNVYRYAFANPLDALDPTGLAPCQSNASACVCCKGGNLDICWNQSNIGQPYRRCIEEHERDHIRFWKKWTCNACEGVPNEGIPQLHQVPQDFAEDFRKTMECSGYRAEFKCLQRHRREATDKKYLWKRMYQELADAAARSFGCNVQEWFDN